MEVFHSGERTVHDLLGVQKIANSASTMIQQTLPKKFMNFLNGQNSFVMSSMDQRGRVWSSFLAGNLGIIQAIEADIVKINTKINEGDPLFLNILQHKEVGILVIDFASRIRIRINGKVSIVYPDGNFEIKIEQVFGNCPKYIQARRFEYKAVEEIVNKKLHPLNTLNKKQQNWISESDTFIIASASFEGKMDISHRGGMPGFVHVINEKSIIFPDYSGNMLFNTLGNIFQNPNVGLLFFDFNTGGTLQITGEASIIWNIDQDILSKFPGAQRLVQFQIIEVLEVPCYESYNWEFLNYSTFNPK
ncbi:FAD-binding oxidoreductase [Bacillus thuringiensis]|uniref:pyridoxamine 5'-phosphate oxidase family protein n=1 Tax=Bacillus TaxID=1386 RepID=UPI0008E8E2F8|nr:MULTISPECIES: pyridoxamine 5'-phosphate oxidase family protein [Bacillus]MCU4955138.1 pyridoxamine 5'-phosphate oxidase family protein [Bacillus cereus]MED3268200.1 pyridoxamine 5'-phosphate oxidase family protein [Bacillus thuringiensis]PFA86113.1 FAD-binding oxidoreductase [Bacillus thuringiensis]PFE96325.1 FAD-binding oxidoreductase [Bacillus thuringiensis]PFV39069.1 FAD-binding oxidoreductase [Bacillus thuringiensis]